MTTYNGAKYVCETIDSVCRQTFSNWELIIVDDGSEDNTSEVVSGFRDERIFFFPAGRIGINGKLKNIALAKATGELIAFIDHDDLWDAEKLEKQVKMLRDYPQAGFCLTGGYNFKKKGEPFEYHFKLKEGIMFDNIFLSIFKSEVAGWTQALLVRRQCIETAGFFNEVSLFADPEFIFRLAYHYKAAILYEPLMFHRLHEKSYTFRDWIKSHKDGLSIIRSLNKSGMLPGHAARNVLFRSHIHFGEKCLQNRIYGKAAGSFLKGWRCEPLSIVPLKKIVKTAIYFLRRK